MQELAGHASSEITMEIYTHVNMEAKRAAADVVSDLFSEPVEAAPAVTPIVQVEPPRHQRRAPTHPRKLTS